MKKNIIFVLVICFSIMTGCTTLPTDDIKTDAKSDQKVNFKGYKSYAWLGSAGVLNDPEGKWKQPNFDVDHEIRFLIDRELRKRGVLVATGKPDMVVAYALGVDMAALKLKENPETKTKMLENVPKGALTVILADAKTRYVIWIGKATSQVQQNPDMEIVKKRLDYAVTQMMNKIPK